MEALERRKGVDWLARLGGDQQGGEGGRRSDRTLRGLSRVSADGRGGTRLDEGVGTVIGRPGGQVGGAPHGDTMIPKEGDSGKTKMALSPTRHRKLVLTGQI